MVDLQSRHHHVIGSESANGHILPSAPFGRQDMMEFEFKDWEWIDELKARNKGMQTHIIQPTSLCWT